jgi:hypothetical protein
MRGGANQHGMRGWPRKKGEGTTPVSAFCSRNAHDRNVLVQRPQSGLTRVPFPGIEVSGLGDGDVDSLVVLLLAERAR